MRPAPMRPTTGGGGEGSRARVTLKRGTDFWERLAEAPPRYEELSGDEELVPQQVATHPIRTGDAGRNVAVARAGDGALRDDQPRTGEN